MIYSRLERFQPFLLIPIIKVKSKVDIHATSTLILSINKRLNFRLRHLSISTQCPPDRWRHERRSSSAHPNSTSTSTWARGRVWYNITVLRVDECSIRFWEINVVIVVQEIEVGRLKIRGVEVILVRRWLGFFLLSFHLLRGPVAGAE